MARTSTGRKQKNKNKAKARNVVRRRAIPARLEISDMKRPEDEARSKDEMEKATGTGGGKDHSERGASGSPVSEIYSPPAMHPLQWLLAWPFISLQIWQNAMLGVRWVER
jgi:hypothetical protein